MLSVQCPNCTATLSIDEKYAGQSGTCNKCGDAFTVPGKSITSRRLYWTVFPVVLAIGIGVWAVITLPGFAGYFYRQGVGHAFWEILDADSLSWESMSTGQRAPYQARFVAEGYKCAVLMVFGEHIPGYLFVLITIGLLTRSISHSFRVFLRSAFLAVWVLGMLFLALGSGYWGQAIPFPQSLAPALMIYLLAAAFFGIIIGVTGASTAYLLRPNPKAHPHAE